MRDGLRVGSANYCSYTKWNINLSYLIVIDRKVVEVYGNAIIIIKFSVFGCSVFHLKLNFSDVFIVRIVPSFTDTLSYTSQFDALGKLLGVCRFLTFG